MLSLLERQRDKCPEDRPVYVGGANCPLLALLKVLLVKLSFSVLLFPQRSTLFARPSFTIPRDQRLQQYLLLPGARFVTSVTNGGQSCFSDGWLVSARADDPKPATGETSASPLLTTIGTVFSPEACQRLCREVQERCVLWEWDVLAELCRLWGSGVTLRRPADLPLGLSALASLSSQDTMADVAAQHTSHRLKKILEPMRTVVGPRMCVDAATLEPREATVRSCPSPRGKIK